MDADASTLTTTPFDLRDALQGEDGEWYHLPTLRALHRLGKLATDSPAYMALMRILHLEAPAHAQLNA